MQIRFAFVHIIVLEQKKGMVVCVMYLDLAVKLVQVSGIETHTIKNTKRDNYVSPNF